MLTKRTESQGQQTIFPAFARMMPTRAHCILPAGLGVMTFAWLLAWFGPEPLRWYTFVPLWVGFILTVNGLTLHLTGASYLSTAPRIVTGMFAVSMPCWWIFEALNKRLGNWHYHLPVEYDLVAYGSLATIAFSTVIPAVLGTATLYRSLLFKKADQAHRPLPQSLSNRFLWNLVVVGILMLALVLAVPRQAFPLAWLSLVFIVDPLNALRGYPSVFIQASRRDWSRIVPLALAGLTCGVFWEMWNFWSIPKWEYVVPYVGFWPIFEMPVLGYGGYIPFALELYALWTLVTSVIPSLALHRETGRFRPV